MLMVFAQFHLLTSVLDCVHDLDKDENNKVSYSCVFCCFVLSASFDFHKFSHDMSYLS